MDIAKVIEGMEMRGRVSFRVRPVATSWESTNHIKVTTVEKRVAWITKHLKRSSVLEVMEDGKSKAVLHLTK